MKKNFLLLFFLSVMLTVGTLSAQQAEENPGQNDQTGQETGGEARHHGHGRGREQFVPFEKAFESAKSDEPIKLNQPDFVTEDQVQLCGLFYKGNADESTTPVILLHGKDGKKEDWEPVAKVLAGQGMAVLVPDLRGYGESTRAMKEDYSGGGVPFVRPSQYKADSFTESDWDSMNTYDGWLWYDFLTMLHNEKKLNLRKLVFIGNGYGCAVAGNWIFGDWKATPKKGRFARGLILVSPEADEIYGKLGASRAKAGSVHYKVFVGKLDEEKFADAEKAGLQLAKEKDSVESDARKVSVEAFSTDKEGMALLKVASYKIPEMIVQFINEECEADSSQQKWQAIKLSNKD